MISGTGLGLPGANKPVMDVKNAARILSGEQFIGPVPQGHREEMARRRVTQLVKTADGSGHFQVIEDPKDVIKLAGLPGSFALTAEYGVSEKLVEALDSTTQLAMAAGLNALREAGIPLVQTWKRTTTGKYLPERWMLPEAMRDETGVVFASAFPGYNRFADEAQRYYTYEGRLAQKRQLEELLETTRDACGYLLKSISGEAFIEALRGLEQGIPPFSPGLAAKLLDEFARLAGEEKEAETWRQGDTQKGKEAETRGRGAAEAGIGLTERQTEVLRLVAAGLTYKQVGEKLCLSEATVRYHMVEIMHILHLDNRNQVIAYAGDLRSAGKLDSKI